MNGIFLICLIRKGVQYNQNNRKNTHYNKNNNINKITVILFHPYTPIFNNNFIQHETNWHVSYCQNHNIIHMVKKSILLNGNYPNLKL